uniref:Glial fibrillary acidic protein-like n=1 Tax=Stegastes partitus TaxID=144197 RepID=A0A3B4ZQJ1_9TELE
MSRSPERRSSYRRHFEGSLASVSGCQVRVSSPSPARKENRHRSASFTRGGGSTGRRAFSSKSRMTSVSLGALCFGMSMGLGPQLDLDAAAAENQAFMMTRTSERQEMVVLNDRLAAYIEKVRTLESQNKLLESEIEVLKNRHVRPSALRQLYESQLKELSREAEQMREQRDVTSAAKEAMLGQLEALKAKYQEAVEARRKTEQDIEALRPDVDRATSARIALEKQLGSLEAELVFLQRVHKEEIEELMQQILSSASKVDSTFGLPDLSSALRQIQSQYDSIAAKNLQEMDVWYRSKFQDLNDASTKHAQSVRSVREEIAGYKKDGRVEAMKLDLKVTKEKIALLMREYQDLLNVKMSLELEITTYKLIEGEDSRLSVVVHHLPVTGGLRLTSSVSAASASASALVSASGSSGPKLDASPCDRSSTGAGRAPGRVSVASTDTQTDVELQATEKIERKTLLITVKTDENTYESDTQERTFTISGAA